ncbi:MAG: hypothetical protein A2998_00145 [Candidatus Staskawiczbacteria bacterium RIFCSPLOWO2_01_FULL_37_25b]|uniref:Uncharacterized protein n=1 Tax=Candidatus Staskawiczbacteria bacterium RIFCSPLOWO2_01_FULL_37_25b TaxID=1802213 RepID=A0A1G2I940_9BACT|nr:MAG: hypothetical protein A2998_00145 [Candidatus Staskawiczbacteria bacterium RIFCSPLOWO2_01_FULL_37_25b]
MADLFTKLDEEGKLESFLNESAENNALVAQFSYWEKWLEKDQRRLVDQVVAEKSKIYEGREDTESLPLHLEKKFTPEELKLIFSATSAIQLCFGCSKSCPFCAFDAVPGTREHIPYSQLANLFQKYGQSLAVREPILYWASEPSDYASKMGLEDKTYQDIHQLAVEYAGYTPHVTSRESSDEGWIDFLKTKTKSPRVSAYGYPQDKVEQILEKAEGEITIERGYKGEHSKGIGVSSLKFDVEGERGVGCIDGVLLTPRGLYNVVRLPISKEFPQGQIIMPLESVSQNEIKPGDKLKDILKTSVVVNELTMSEASDSDQWDTYKKKPFTRDVKIRTKDGIYRVWYNEGGVVDRVEELSIAEEENKRIKEIEIRRAERQKVAEEKEKYKEKIQELADRKKRYMKYLANWRKEHRGESKTVDYYKNTEIMETEQELYDAIDRAVERGVIKDWSKEVSDKNYEWLRKEWIGYVRETEISSGRNSAERILKSRNSERTVNICSVCGIDVVYDKWSDEAALAKRKRPQ